MSTGGKKGNDRGSVLSSHQPTRLRSMEIRCLHATHPARGSFVQFWDKSRIQEHHGYLYQKRETSLKNQIYQFSPSCFPEFHIFISWGSTSGAEQVKFSQR